MIARREYLQQVSRSAAARRRKKAMTLAVSRRLGRTLADSEIVLSADETTVTVGETQIAVASLDRCYNCDQLVTGSPEEMICADCRDLVTRQQAHTELYGRSTRRRHAHHTDNSDNR